MTDLGDAPLETRSASAAYHNQGIHQEQLGRFGFVDTIDRVERWRRAACSSAWRDVSIRSLGESSVLEPRKRYALRRWGLMLWKRRGFKCAATALARKMAVVLHAMWKSGTPFNPTLDAPHHSRTTAQSQLKVVCRYRGIARA